MLLRKCDRGRFIKRTISPPISMAPDDTVARVHQRDKCRPVARLPRIGACTEVNLISQLMKLMNQMPVATTDHEGSSTTWCASGTNNYISKGDRQGEFRSETDSRAEERRQTQAHKTVSTYAIPGFTNSLFLFIQFSVRLLQSIRLFLLGHAVFGQVRPGLLR